MIAALYVEPMSIYSTAFQIETWTESKDARKYKGPHPVIAHPPCERWGRYWGGGPMHHGKPTQKLLGDDNGCFAHALWSVRTFGGILEHPEASHAFKFFGLPLPNRNGGWTDPDKFGARSCCVAQGNYGHKAQKLTWLYAKINNYPELRWGLCAGKTRLDEGFRSNNHRKTVSSRRKRTSFIDNVLTPISFAQLLVDLVTANPKSRGAK